MRVTFTPTGAPSAYYVADTLRGTFATVTRRPHGWDAATTETPRRVVVGARTRAAAVAAVTA